MDDIKKELKIFAKGEYVFSESEDPNQFYVYRKDDGVLGDIGRLAMDMFQDYVCYKMFEGEITTVVANNVCFEQSNDDKRIRLTVKEFETKLDIEPIYITTPINSSFGQRVKSLFHKRRK